MKMEKDPVDINMTGSFKRFGSFLSASFLGAEEKMKSSERSDETTAISVSIHLSTVLWCLVSRRGSPSSFFYFCLVWCHLP